MSSTSTAYRREGPGGIWKYYTDRQSSSTPGEEKKKPIPPPAPRAAKSGLLWLLLRGSWFALLLLGYWWFRRAAQRWKREKKDPLMFAAQTRPNMKLSSRCISRMVSLEKDLASSEIIFQRRRTTRSFSTSEQPWIPTAGRRCGTFVLLPTFECLPLASATSCGFPRHR